MANAEQIFNSCILDLLVPDAVLQLPKIEDGMYADKWLDNVRGRSERRKAFFDENLVFYLALRFSDPSSEKPSEPSSPPPLLLSFLNHLYVSLEATYISANPMDQQDNGQLPAPPMRSSSAGFTAKPKGLGVPMPIFPPQTPSPLPTTNDLDKKYAYSEGTLLKAYVWGEDASEQVDTFRLLWSQDEKCWVAIYRLSVVVAFVRTNIADPILCLTASVTLRDKPLLSTPQRQNLTDLIKSAGHLPSLLESSPLSSAPSSAKLTIDSRERNLVRPLEEVNLLEGLSSALPGSDSNELYLPTSRLGSSLRQAYSLPPVSPMTPETPVPNSGCSLPVLRKSFRRTLFTVSGFHVRMRTVFIPQIYIPGETDTGQEVANEESTVVLCVEIENSGESGVGFSVESVGVSIGGEGAKIRLIGWGEQGSTNPTMVFPLFMRSTEQYNLLYAVSFLRPTETNLSPGIDQDRAAEFQRSVSINIIGKPFVMPGEEFALIDSENLTYPTSSFLSRWNCVLDLTPRRDRDSLRSLETSPSSRHRNALPYPSSPFPVPGPHTHQAQEQAMSHPTSNTLAIAGSKRHTIASPVAPKSRVEGQPGERRPTSFSPIMNNDSSPPQFTMTKQSARSLMVGSPMSHGALSPPLPPLPPGVTSPSAAASSNERIVPPTPAYPSYENKPLTPRPTSVNPSFGQMGSVGLGIDARREKAYQPGIPQTPAPRLLAGERLPVGRPSSTDFVVSVTLIRSSGSSASLTTQRHIYPLDEFSLEIFVFNQSPHQRTLEATYHETKRDRHIKGESSSGPSTTQRSTAPGFVSLESRVRIGPLGPSACQSVNMRFLALLPGIHTIDGLILTDVDTGDSVSLRSVMDFAVLSRIEQ